MMRASTPVVVVAALVIVSTLAAGCNRTRAVPTGPTATPPPTTAPPFSTVASLAIAPGAVLGGASAEGTVTLSGAAPAGGAPVTLASSHAAAAVPASVSVPAGATSATFSITTHEVSSATAVTITATAGGVSRTAPLEVTPVPRQATGFGIEPDRIRGGETATGRVRLGVFAPVATSAGEGAAPTALVPVVITFTSNHPAVQVPSSVTVPAGETEATFPITTTAVPQSVHVILTASSGGETRTTGMQVLPAGPTLQSLAPGAAQVGTTVVVTLTGTGFIPGDTAVLVGGAAAGVSVTNVVVGSPTSLTATIAVDASTTPGTYPVTVETSGGFSESRPFTVSAAPPPSGSQTFTFTGAQQNFVVPAGVTTVTIEASGAQGGQGGNGGGAGGNGGTVTATIAVTPGETLAVFVGGRGGDGGTNNGQPGTAGSNSGGGAEGGAGGDPGFAGGSGGGGGGGASDVRRGGTALADRVVVAGGGGGGGARNIVWAGGPGGDGGDTTGAAGAAGAGPIPGNGGGGGTQVAGGTGGSGLGAGRDGGPGAAGTGGAGGAGERAAGGGGGGGYFGGGGGAGGFLDNGGGGGAGGGSSFAIGSATSVTHQQGVRTGNGVVVITW